MEINQVEANGHTKIDIAASTLPHENWKTMDLTVLYDKDQCDLSIAVVLMTYIKYSSKPDIEEVLNFQQFTFYSGFAHMVSVMIKFKSGNKKYVLHMYQSDSSD